MIHVDQDIGENPEKPPSEVSEFFQQLEEIKKPLVVQEELPPGYTVPTDLDSIQKIYSQENKFGSREYPEVFRRYACEAWRVCNQSFLKASKKLGVSPSVIQKWVSHYIPHEIARKRALEIATSNHMDLLEMELERDLRKVLRKARKQMDNASYSQLMIGFGIMADKLDKIKKMPKAVEKSVHLDVLKGLPDWALDKILDIIEECKKDPNYKRKAVTDVTDAEFEVKPTEEKK